MNSNYYRTPHKLHYTTKTPTVQKPPNLQLLKGHLHILAKNNNSLLDPTISTSAESETEIVT